MPNKRLPSFFVLLVFFILISSCATFDKTNILPGQRIPGMGFSFTTPTDKPWFTVVYGNSHRIRLSQLNDDDSYTINIAVNVGPPSGMYRTAQLHLDALKRQKLRKPSPKGFAVETQREWIDTRYGKLCVRYNSYGKDYRGRAHGGPALVETIGLTCAHEEIDNALINLEITRRAEVDAAQVDLEKHADALFTSLEYESMD